MKKSEIARKVKYLMALGSSKTEVYSELSGPGVKESQLAWAIATYPDQVLYERNKGKVRALAALLSAESIVGISSFVLVSRMPGNGAAIFVGLIALFPLLFAWRFCRPDAAAFTGYVVLALGFVMNQVLLQFKLTVVGAIWGLSSGLEMLKMLADQVVSTPASEYLGLALGLIQVGCVWEVKRRLFPELGLFGAKKRRGRYMYSI
ncbi:MAG TPA: hypothetical protein VLS52_12325 [Rudaea sp.]|nr:hypothetical protein [Rudaea sp.]